MLKERVRRFTSNTVEWGLALISVILLCIDIFQFIDSKYRIEPLIRVIFNFVFALSLFIWGEKCIPIELMIFALALGQFIKFDNYTSFCLVCICCVLKKNKIIYVIPMLNLYFFDVVIVCMRHQKTVLHFLRHFIVCICLFVALQFLIIMLKKENVTYLDLTDEERKIIDAIAVHGLKQKEIDGYKQNTVAKKLAKCCKKNNCKNNDELYERYKEELALGINYPQNSNNIYDKVYSILKSFELS